MVGAGARVDSFLVGHDFVSGVRAHANNDTPTRNPCQVGLDTVGRSEYGYSMSTNNLPITKSAFKAAAIAAFKRANPHATDVVVEWVRQPVAVAWADKTPGYSATMRVTADGFRTRNMTASYCDGIMVR